MWIRSQDKKRIFDMTGSNIEIGVENQKEKLKKLFQLIKGNSNLPILPLVESEIVADDGYKRWTASWGSAYVGEYIIGNERVWFKSDDETEEVLNDYVDGIDFYEMEEEKVNEEFEKLPWIKAIIVNIDVPEA